jgi:acetylornithine deacetylase/succinyl-diaminopimelate desuccinylase-like protein
MNLRERIASLMSQVRPELAELVAIRSVADPRQFPPEQCARAAQWVLDSFAGAGFPDARLAEMADGSHVVLGTRPGPDADAPTVLRYARCDIQPPLNQADWRTPPFELTAVDAGTAAARSIARATSRCT